MWIADSSGDTVHHREKAQSKGAACFAHDVEQDCHKIPIFSRNTKCLLLGLSLDLLVGVPLGTTDLLALVLALLACTKCKSVICSCVETCD